MSTEDELRSLDEELAKLKQEHKDQRAQIGTLGAADAADTSAMITQADEQAAVIEALEQRREALRQRLTQG